MKTLYKWKVHKTFTLRCSSVIYFLWENENRLKKGNHKAGKNFFGEPSTNNMENCDVKVHTWKSSIFF